MRLGGLLLLVTRASARTAVCVSGQLRTFGRTWPGLLNLTQAVPGPTDWFLFVSLNETYRKSLQMKAYHSVQARSSFETALEAMKPVTVQYYESVVKDSADFADATLRSYAREAPAAGECHRNEKKPKCCHFSHHGPQFWGVAQCFAMITARERVAKVRYDWVVRVRPDAVLSPRQLRAVAAATRRTQDPLLEKRAWLRPGTRSDAFALLTRAAMDAYAGIWGVFQGGCAAIGLGHKPDIARLDPICTPLKIRVKTGTECLVAAQLHAGNVTIEAHTDFSAGLLRPVEPRSKARKRPPPKKMPP
ncbi:hypothetical protein M885DRAFT_511925 [Pelagophyceae sp. CCMP2097]|nr:hypothetical protein M885DRAFT_511925 [Pelagophyceae sp. CCMP2097]